MSYIPTNYSTNINGALVDLGQLNNNTASVNIVPPETYTNSARIVSFPGKTVVNQSAISLSIDTTGSITGNQTYTFGPQKRGMWVAAGQATGVGGALAYSYDGINWTAAASIGGLASGAYAVAWNGTMWVAGGDAAPGGIDVVYSYDGSTWNSASQVGTITSMYCVAWNGTMWVVGGTGGQRIMYSYNGVNWTNATLETGVLTVECRCLAWNGTMWIAGGQVTGPKGALAYSYDGINWKNVTLGTGVLSVSCRCVAWNGTMWLAGGQNGTVAAPVGAIASSTDGLNWSIIPSTGEPTNVCWGLAWNGVLWVAVGDSTASPNAIGLQEVKLVVVESIQRILMTEPIGPLQIQVEE